MVAHSVEPGTVLADRYVVEDLLAEEGESFSWRARDRVLARSVVLQVLPSSSPYAADMLAAAKRASRVADPRILQVLDAVDDGELSYVVREWASGQSLDVILAEGPLPSRRAAWLVREVAGAIDKAHRLDLHHRRLAPDTVVITKSSGVKVIGLGTFAALQDDLPDDEAELSDTRALGRLLYACLTARWPGAAVAGLPAAPTEHRRLLRPRQVRAGVSRSLDTVCDRILGDPPRYGEPITTVAEVKEALSDILAEDGVDTGSTPPAGPMPTIGPLPPPAPAVLSPGEGGPSTGDQPVTVPAVPPRSENPLGRTLMWLVFAVLLVGAVLLAYLVGQGFNRDDATTPSGSPDTRSEAAGASDVQPIRIQDVQDFDPPPDGSGDENPDEVQLAIDGDPSTAWQTMEYYNNPELGGIKDGVGLVVDLGRTEQVQQVTVTLLGQGTDLQLRAAPSDAATMPSDSADEYTELAEQTGVGSQARFDLQEPAETRFLLVWLTRLPEESPGSYRGSIAEIQVAG